jgi:hypothetical protein
VLTDDDLSSQLRTAMQRVPDLTYDRPVPRVRRSTTPVLLAVPALATAGIVAALALPADAPAPTSSSALSPTTELVTVSTTVAGMTLTYERAADAEEPFTVDVTTAEVPSDARELAVDGSARAWVGTDPATGETAAWLTSPVRNGGQTFTLLAPDLTQDQLAAIVLGG